VELSISSSQVVITHTYPWEVTHITVSGTVNYGYEQVNESRTIGMMINGTMLGSVKMNTYHKAVGIRLGNVTGYIEMLIEALNSSLSLIIHGYGVSKLYSALGYVDNESLFTAQWIDPFTINATIQLITPIKVGAAPLEPCPEAPV